VQFGSPLRLIQTLGQAQCVQLPQNKALQEHYVKYIDISKLAAVPKLRQSVAGFTARGSIPVQVGSGFLPVIRCLYHPTLYNLDTDSVVK
jgi:hypothetical protein